MIFSELYSAYYNTVAAILRSCAEQPLDKKNISEIINAHAFGESILSIEPAIASGRWQLVHADGTTPIKHAPTMPLTALEKSWLKAIYEDPRIRLFIDDVPDFPDVKPLFTSADYCIFDKYSDGDPYEDEEYIKNFRLILDAIKNEYPLDVEVTNRKGSVSCMHLMPEYLEYSEKDDKFRLIGSGDRYGDTVNLGRIVSCRPYKGNLKLDKTNPRKQDCVEFELLDQRNALERVLLHFAHFKKEAEKLDENKYKVKVYYDRDDETEMVIRILSFGPMIRVTGPGHFTDLIKERLIKQKSCGQ